MSPQLKALLIYVKSADKDQCWNSWKAVRASVFAEIYHPEMSLVAVIQVLCGLYIEAVEEPRFELQSPNNPYGLSSKLLAPIVGLHSIDLKPISVNTQYSIEQFYDAIISRMLGELIGARIDWCRKELWES